MSKNNQFNLILLILLLLSAVMIYMGYTKGIWPPALTGIGFIFIVWALRLIKR